MPRIWAWTSKIVIKSLLTSCMCSMLKDIICFRSYCFSGGCSVMIMIHCKPVPLWKKVISQIGFENCFELSVAWHSLLKYIGALHKWCHHYFQTFKLLLSHPPQTCHFFTSNLHNSSQQFIPIYIPHYSVSTR